MNGSCRECRRSIGKPQYPIFVTLFGTVMFTKLVHSLKHCPPIVLTEFGIFTLDNFLQKANADPSKSVTPLGIVMDCNAVLEKDQ